MTLVPPLWRPLAPPEDAAFYDGPNPSTQHIKAGWRKDSELASFQVDTIWDKDVSVAMRDGVRIRTDIFRPADSDTAKVPALVAWSPYGKSGRGKTVGSCSLTYPTCQDPYLRQASFVSTWSRVVSAWQRIDCLDLRSSRLLIPPSGQLAATQ
jgi:hypothetical protein